MEITNFDDFVKKSYDDHQHHWAAPKWPFRGLVLGSSGSGKTNTVLNFITKWLDYDTLIVVAKDLEEDKYEVLKEWAEERKKAINEENELIERSNRKKPKSQRVPLLRPFCYLFVTDIADMPPISAWDKGDEEEDNGGSGFERAEPFKDLLLRDWKTRNTLIVFDDMVKEPGQEVVEQFMKRCRKRNISLLYLTQGFFEVPKFARGQVTFIMMFQVADQRDVGRVMGCTCGGSLPASQVTELYKKALAHRPHNFLYADTAKKLPFEAYRSGFNGFFPELI